MPALTINAVRLTVPIAELLAGLGALAADLSARSPHIPALLIAGLFAAFTLYSGALWLSPPAEATDCGCGLRASPITDWRPLVAQNAACTTILAGSSVLLAPRRRRAVSS